jgi:hypothetical protein
MPQSISAHALRFPLILGALIAFGPLSVDMYLPALPALEREFASAPGPVQLTLSAYLLGMGARTAALRPSLRPLRAQAAALSRPRDLRARLGRSARWRPRSSS